MARKKTPKVPRPSVIAFRVTAEEEAEIREAARFYGMTVSDWTRTNLLKHTRELVSITVNGVRVQ